MGDEYIQISVLGRYMKYYCVRDGTFSTIMPIPQARDPALMLSVKFDFLQVPLTHHYGVGAPFIKQYHWCLSQVVLSSFPGCRRKRAKLKQANTEEESGCICGSCVTEDCMTLQAI